MTTAIKPNCDWWFMHMLRTNDERCYAAELFCREGQPFVNFTVAHFCLFKENLYLTVPLTVACG